jgi:hypothetical protein
MADLVQTVDHVLQDQKVKTEDRDRSAGRDQKDKIADHVLQDRKARTADRDRSAGRDQNAGRDQKGKTVLTELLL